MARTRIIVVATLLIGLSIALPLAALLYGAWHLAIREEQARLSTVAQLALTRAQRAHAEVSQALHAMERQPLPPCSPAHIARMRALTITNGTVEELGYFHQRRLMCTSWGLVEGDVRQPHAQYTTGDGTALNLRVHPIVSLSDVMIAMQWGQHNALVDPARLVDVLIDPAMTLTLATRDGQILGQRNAPDAALLARVLAHPGDGHEAATFHAVARDGDWIAVATEPRTQMLQHLRREQLLLLPFALLLTLGMVGGIVWASRRRLSPRGELAIAVRKREFVVHYQPVIHLPTGACVGAEALVRWRRPDGSLVRPDLFIPLAEDSGLIRSITDQVIDSVLQDLGDALAADRSLHVAINLCADDIRTGRAVQVLDQKLRGRDVRTGQLLLEATERGFIDVDAARTTIRRARASGYALAIDDFGTGYSSLQYLQSLPLDALKIDKSFIETIGLDSATSSVTDHIISMARALGLLLVAEGVETQAQADYLTARGVDFAQGWLFAKAMPALDFLTFHAQRRQLHGPGPFLIQRAACTASDT
ncbi:MAG: EAL domain-containing protein [Pseudoxanthomonas sp.]